MWCAYKTHWTISHHESPTPKRGTWTTLTRHSWLKSCQNIKHISQYKMHIDLGYPLLTKYIYRNAYAFLDFTMPHLLGNYFGWKTSVNWHVINLTSDGRRNVPRNRRYHAPLWRQVVGYFWASHILRDLQVPKLRLPTILYSIQKFFKTDSLSTILCGFSWPRRSTSIFGRIFGQNYRIFGIRWNENFPLPMPAYAYSCTVPGF